MFSSLTRRAAYAAVVGLCVAVLPVPNADARQVPMVGTDQTFDVATWNIEWFGFTGGPFDDEQQLAHVIEVMRDAGIDLWAVQEIADQGDFDRLIDSLGVPYEGYLATESSQQRIGFIYNADIVRPRSVRHILTDFNSDFATRPPLQMEADVTIADSTKRITFITVHMKCCGGTSDYDKRLAAAGRLKNHIDFGTLFNKPVMVLGDFNDELDRSIAGGRDTPYRAFLNDVADYRFESQALDDANLNTYCSNSSCSFGSTLDHILITNELFADIESGSTGRLDALTSAIPGYVSNTSDHLPVYTRMRFGISTGLDEWPAGSAGDVRVDVYPNPAVDDIVVRRSPTGSCDAGCVSGDAEATVFDSAGRRLVDVKLTGAQTVVSVAGLPAGTYFFRVAGSAPALVPFVVVR